MPARSSSTSTSSPVRRATSALRVARTSFSSALVQGSSVLEDDQLGRRGRSLGRRLLRCRPGGRNRLLGGGLLRGGLLAGAAFFAGLGRQPSSLAPSSRAPSSRPSSWRGPSWREPSWQPPSSPAPPSWRGPSSRRGPSSPRPSWRGRLLGAPPSSRAPSWRSSSWPAALRLLGRCLLGGGRGAGHDLAGRCTCAAHQGLLGRGCHDAGPLTGERCGPGHTRWREDMWRADPLQLAVPEALFFTPGRQAARPGG